MRHVALFLNRHPRIGLALAIAWLTISAQANGQGTRADFDRARRLREQSRQPAYPGRVEPQWLTGGTRFWYRIETGPGRHAFVLVDATAGTRAPAFDHARLATAISRVRGEPVDPEALPIRQLAFEDGGTAVRFTAEGTRYRHDLGTGGLEPLGPDDTPPRRLRGDGPRRSRRTGDETEIVFINRGDAAIVLYWLDSSGDRQAYGSVAAGEERAQHTFAGHVWLVVEEGGRELGWFVAEDEPSRVEIDGLPASGQVDREATDPRDERAQVGRSPDGRWVAFLRDHDVHLRDAETGDERRLSTDGTAIDPYEGPLAWSPDSTWLALRQVRQTETRRIHLIEAAPEEQLQPRLIDLEYAKPGDPIPHPRPRLFQVPERRAIPIDESRFPDPWSLDEFHWAPDSSRFTFLYNQRGHQVLRVLGVDSASGAVRTVVDEQSPTFVDYANKTFLRHLDSTGELIWMSERSGWNHLYLVDTGTGTIKNPITTGAWVVREVDHIDDAARQVWFRALGIHPDQDPYHEHLARVNFDGTGLVVLTEGDGTHQVQFSPDRAYLVDTYSRVDLPPVTELRRSSDGALVCALERVDPEALRAIGWNPPERFAAKGRDGSTDIHGVIYRPSDYRPEDRYPVVEKIYAGPQGAFVPKAFERFDEAQALAELGFIVVQIDGMGTNWRSKAFHDVCWKNLGDSGFPDRIAWMRAAAAEDPAMDLSRVGIYGGSAGGQSALRALLAHGDFYKAAAADCGCHDNRMDKIWWNELWMGWPVGPHYSEQSNVTQAHRLQGKLLLTVGALDRNVDPSSTYQVAEALIRAGKDFELVVFPAGGHGSGESPYGVRRRHDFFVRSLLSVEPRVE